MAQPAQIIVRDHGYNKLMKRASRFRRMGRQRVHVGILGQEGSKRHGRSKTTVAEVAAIHEFGAPSAGIPQRAFIRPAVDENRKKIGDIQRRVAVGVLQGKITNAQGLAIVGEVMVGVVQRKIESNVPPPLAAATILRKGSSTSLIDSGQMRQSVSFEVRGS